MYIIHVYRCKDVFKAVGNDDIDDYINSLKACEIDTITRAKFKRRLVEITNEVIKFEKLLAVAKPGDFDMTKWRADLETRISQPPIEAPKPAKKIIPKQEIKEPEPDKPKIKVNRHFIDLSKISS